MLTPTSRREPVQIGDSTERTTVGFKEMHEATLSGTRVINVDMGEAHGTDLRRAQLSGVTFIEGITDSRLEGASGQDVEVRHAMRRTRLDGVRISGLRIARGTAVDEVCLDGARINDSRWAERVQVKDSSFRWATMRRSRVASGTYFENCDCTGLDLSNSEFDGGNDTVPTFVRIEIDMANFSGCDMRYAHMSEVALRQRIYFVDDDTLPPLEPGSHAPTEAGREFMTRAMTDEQFVDYTDALGADETEVRSALERLSPALVPVYSDGSVGQRGELLRRAVLGEDIEVLSSIQSEIWDKSLKRNPMLVLSADQLYT
jgi:uncharacterized protein YjbI with pentapeptide repeats